MKEKRVVGNYFHLREKSLIPNQGARAVVIQVSAQSEGELVYPIRFLPTINLQPLQLVYDYCSALCCFLFLFASKMTFIFSSIGNALFLNSRRFFTIWQYSFLNNRSY